MNDPHKTICAPKLKAGDTVRIITPARSLKLPWINQELIDLATKRLKNLRLNVTFGKYINEIDDFDSSSIEKRVEDLHDAFSDTNVKLVLTVIGGYNSHQLLSYLDYNLISNNPKRLCGYSDITALTTAIYAKTGLITYSGPHFFNFGQKRGFEFTEEHFIKCHFENKKISLSPALQYIDERWAINQDQTKFIKNPAWLCLQEGHAEGTILGGNLGTLALLYGTEFMPQIKDSIILFAEDDSETHPQHFDRYLQAFLHQPMAKQLTGIVFGRFQKESKMTASLLQQIVESKKELRNIPIVSGLDFGHTTPLITFPIGGKANLDATNSNIQITILDH